MPFGNKCLDKMALLEKKIFQYTIYVLESNMEKSKRLGEWFVVEVVCRSQILSLEGGDRGCQVIGVGYKLHVGGDISI